MVLADNYRSGFEAHGTDHTAEPVIVEDTVIVGKTNGNGATDAELAEWVTCGVAFSRTNNLYIRDTEFVNFPTGTYITESASQN